MCFLLEGAHGQLADGRPAIDVVTDVVAELEDCGLFVAGRGGSPDTSGDYELDAALIDGWSGRAGAVAALKGFRNPVRVARLVAQRTSHVLLAGAGAGRFALEQGAEPISDERAWYTQAAQGESNHVALLTPVGTVGCVALDRSGRLASASSTAGLFGKLPGRISDKPVIGAGCWADRSVAVSCTGQGEYFIQSACAARLAFDVERGTALSEAAQRSIDRIAAMGGEGGLIAVDVAGNVVTPFAAEGMKRGFALADGRVHCAIFE